MTGEQDSIEKLAKRILPRMTGKGAFLIRPREGGLCGVFTARERWRAPSVTLDVSEVEALEERDWIACSARSEKSLRYRLTPAGRAALRRLGKEGRGADRHRKSHQVNAEKLFQLPGEADARPIRVNIGESPLGWLSRRSGPDGQPFLTALEVEAGERFRADFERAQLGPRVTQDWRAFLAPAGASPGAAPRKDPVGGAEAARKRVAAAMEVLGTELADAVMRTCCFLEGLEAVENDMGWSARSGKVVLRIGLRRLISFYGLEARGPSSSAMRTWQDDAMRD